MAQARRIFPLTDPIGMSAFFVTATGTDIGKTFVTAGLVRHLRAVGLAMDALKPVASGFDWATAAVSDAGVLLDALGEPLTPEAIDRISPWRFAAPLSPDMAAARENRSIDFDALVAFSRSAIAASPGALFIEGVGGVMVPLDTRHTVLDWMEALALPVVIVAGSHLGTISHTLTALDACLRRGLEPAAIVINESGESPVPMEETKATLRRFVSGTPICTIPRVKIWSAARSDFAALWQVLAGC